MRCWCETTFSTITLLNALGMTASWFYTRLLVLPYMIYLLIQPDIFHGMNFISLKFLIVHLCILFVLHVFWFGRMLSVISKFLIGGGKLQEEPEMEKKQK